MKRIMIAMTLLTAGLMGCSGGKDGEKAEDQFQWKIDEFADIRILRYQIPDWDSLTLKQKELLYYFR